MLNIVGFVVSLSIIAKSVFKLRISSLFVSAKTACCLNPVVFALSHPKFREAINREIPCFGSGEGISSGADKETVVQEAPTGTC